MDNSKYTAPFSDKEREKDKSDAKRSDSQDYLENINRSRERDLQEASLVDPEILGDELTEPACSNNKGGYDQVDELVETLGGLPRDRRNINEYIESQIFLELREQEDRPGTSAEGAHSNNRVDARLDGGSADIANKLDRSETLNPTFADFTPFNNKGRKK